MTSNTFENQEQKKQYKNWRKKTHTHTHKTVSPEWGQRPNGRGQRTNRTPELGKQAQKCKKSWDFRRTRPERHPRT